MLPSNIVRWMILNVLVMVRFCLKREIRHVIRADDTPAPAFGARRLGMNFTVEARSQDAPGACANAAWAATACWPAAAQTQRVRTLGQAANTLWPRPPWQAWKGFLGSVLETLGVATISGAREAPQEVLIEVLEQLVVLLPFNELHVAVYDTHDRPVPMSPR